MEDKVKEKAMKRVQVGSVIIATVVVLAVLASVASVSAAGAIMSCDVSNTEKNTFSAGETVYVIGWLAVDNHVDVYVVNNVNPWTDGLAIPAPVISVMDTTSGAVTGRLTLGVVGSGAGEIPYPGDYDIVYDSNQNGVYDAATDCVDYQLCAGFTTIPEFVTMAIPVAIVLLGALFFMRRRGE